MILGQWGMMGVFGDTSPSPVIDEEQVFKIATTEFSVIGNGQYFGFATRDNISILKFKAVNNFQGGINLSNGCFDFENNSIDKVMIEVDNTPYYITSDTNAITFSKENMIVRFGDLNIPFDYKGKINIVFYVGNDPDGTTISNQSGRYVMMVNYKV